MTIEINTIKPEINSIKYYCTCKHTEEGHNSYYGCLAKPDSVGSKKWLFCPCNAFVLDSLETIRRHKGAR